jgi:hypothetical protein
VRLLKPRDGYRTRVAPAVLGPQIEYYLPSVPAGPVTVEMLDASGTSVSSYRSDAVADRGRGGRGRGSQADSDDPDAAPAGFGRGRGGAAPRVTSLHRINPFVWDVRNQAGLLVPPGPYQARLKVGDTEQTQPFNVLIDPNVAADGVTAADLREQFEHNVRVRQLVDEVNQLVGRVRAAQGRLGNAAGSDATQAKGIESIAGQLLTEPVRYGKPGLQAHITYLATMTTGADQKIGKDAVERYNVLRKELERLRSEADRILK